MYPEVAKIAEKQALLGLRIGRPAEDAQVNQRAGHRWQSKAATVLLNDFDFLIQALFADQANKSLQTHQRARAGDHRPAPLTKFEHLSQIWGRLLPHRTLIISGDNIEV